MLVRRAASADVPILAEAWYAMLREGDLLAPRVDPAWRDVVAGDFVHGIRTGSQIWLVAEEDGILATGAAFLRASPSSVALTGLSATIAGVYTFPRHRRRGCARAVVTALLAACAERGCRHVRLQASEQGRPLYEELGFAAGTEMVLALP